MHVRSPQRQGCNWMQARRVADEGGKTTWPTDWELFLATKYRDGWAFGL